MWTKEALAKEYEKGLVIMHVGDMQLWVTTVEWVKVFRALQEGTEYISVQTLEAIHIMKRSEFRHAVYASKAGLIADQKIRKWLPELQEAALVEAGLHNSSHSNPTFKDFFGSLS